MMLTVPPASSILMDGQLAPVLAEIPGVMFSPSARYRSTLPTFTSTQVFELLPVRR